MSVYSEFEVGAAQPNPYVFVPKYAPVYDDVGSDIGSWGFGSNVSPTPFLSFSQYLVNSGNYLGAYCLAGGEGDIDLAFSGRLIISTISPSFGEIGFVKQNWYNFNDGQYATDANGNLYPSKKDWYKSSITVGIEVPNLMIDNGNQTRPNIFVRVVYNSINPDDPKYFSSDNIRKWSTPKTGSWETSQVNYDLFNWILKTYGSGAAGWYENNSTKPHQVNPFLPKGSYVPLASNNANTEKSQNGQIAQLNRDEVYTMLQIIKHTNPSAYTYKHALDTLNKFAPPGSPNRGKLQGLGVPLI